MTIQYKIFIWARKTNTITLISVVELYIIDIHFRIIKQDKIEINRRWITVIYNTRSLHHAGIHARFGGVGF